MNMVALYPFMRFARSKKKPHPKKRNNLETIQTFAKQQNYLIEFDMEREVHPAVM